MLGGDHIFVQVSVSIAIIGACLSILGAFIGGGLIYDDKAVPSDFHYEESQRGQRWYFRCLALFVVFLAYIIIGNYTLW